MECVQIYISMWYFRFVPNFLYFMLSTFCFVLVWKKSTEKECGSEGGEAEKNFQGIPPRSSIRDAKDRGKDENMIGDATKKSVRIGGGGWISQN